MPEKLDVIFGSSESLNDQQAGQPITNMLIFGIILAAFYFLARKLIEQHNTINAYNKLLGELKLKHALPDSLMNELHLCRQRKDFSDLAKSIRCLKNKSALDKEIIEDLMGFDASALWQALHLFEKAGICSEKEYLNLLAHGKKNPVGMAEAILNFKKARTSIEAFWKILSKIDEPQCFTHAALVLIKDKRMSYAHILTLLSKPSLKETNVLIKTLSCLSEDLLTKENITWIKNLESNKLLALHNFLVSLQGKGLSLSQGQLCNLIEGGVNFNPFTFNLGQYFKDAVIKQDDIDKLFGTPWLLTQDAYEILWRRLPHDSLDSDCLRIICRTVDDSNNSGEALTIAHFDHKLNIQYGEQKFFVLSKQEKEAFENRALGAYALELSSLKEKNIFDESHMPDDYLCSINFQMSKRMAIYTCLSSARFCGSNA